MCTSFFTLRVLCQNFFRASPTESYWGSLRVSETARSEGIARLLFKVGAKCAVDRQGPESISRWGVVSNNSIMTDWSARMGLAGPEVFRRSVSPAISLLQ